MNTSNAPLTRIAGRIGCCGLFSDCGAVIETAKGGTAHGGSALTERSRKVLAAYRRLDAEMQPAAEVHGAALLRLAGQE